jgi:cell division ATPase FtsA
MIVDARLEEIFELINKELMSIGRAAKLPGGAIITGGGASLKGIDLYAKEALRLSARIGVSSGLGGIDEKVSVPVFSAAVGLMLLDLENGAPGSSHHTATDSGHMGNIMGSIGSKITGVFKKLRS